MPNNDADRSGVTVEEKENKVEPRTVVVVPWDDYTEERLAVLLGEDSGSFTVEVSSPAGEPLLGYGCMSNVAVELCKQRPSVNFTVFSEKGGNLKEIPFWGNIMFGLDWRLEQAPRIFLGVLVLI